MSASQHHEPPDAAIARAVAAFNAGRLDAAESICVAVLARDAALPPAHQLLATIRLSQGRAVPAHLHAMASLAARPDHLPSLLLALRAARAAGALADAQALAARAASMAPAGSDAALQVAVTSALLRLDHGDAPAAAAALTALVEQHPAAAFAWYELGRVHQAMRESAAACAAFESALALQPSLMPAWFALSLAAQDAGDLPRAQQALERTLAAAPDDPQARLNLGIVLQEQGQLDAAMGAYAAAYRLRPASFGRIAHALSSAPCGWLPLELQTLRDDLARLSPPDQRPA